MEFAFGITHVRTLVQNELTKAYMTEQELRNCITTFSSPFKDSVTKKEMDDLFDDMRSIHGVRMEVFGSVLSGDDPTHDAKWLSNTRQKNTDWYYWNRYKQYLINQGFPGEVLRETDKKTNAIIELCGDPKVDYPFDRRGMVMGDVQAGKTGNYTALVNKAADVGYRVIIIIAGIHENLRSQTQKRIDEGLIGRDSNFGATEIRADRGRVGVGWEDFRRLPKSLTNRSADFRIGRASQNWRMDSGKDEPFVFVIKKNTNILNHLIKWFKSNNTHKGSELIDLPMILIDDEADNASINIAKYADKISTINSQIRKLLNLFEKSSYVAYTATPFANIFIDPDSFNNDFDKNGFTAGKDLFPEHFIISLDRPDNYFGAKQVFLYDADKQHQSPTRDIIDNEECLPIKIPKGFTVEHLPLSLMSALRAFIISGAIRVLRGQSDKHHSMLVNVSHLTDIQRQVSALIKLQMEEVIIPALRTHCALPSDEALKNVEILEFKKTFDAEFSNVIISWNDILPILFDVANRAEVFEVNSKSSDKLNYPEIKVPANDQITAIAVGGYSLSRGLTLEGLTISYFLRNSKAYDTLLQMARWFGYRPNYADICRIWLPDESKDYYAFIAAASEELRQELVDMASSNNNPRDFGLRVRTHPNTLEITARNKAGDFEEVTVEVGLAHSRIETSTIYNNGVSDLAEQNRASALKLYKNLLQNPPTLVGETNLWKSVPVNLIKAYLADFKNHPASQLTNIDPIIKYIEEREYENLKHWDVAFIGSSKKTATKSEDLSINLKLQQRTPSKQDDKEKVVATRRRFSSEKICNLGMEQAELDLVKSNSSGKHITDATYLRHRKCPLLAIHFLKLMEKDTGLIIQEPPLVAWTIGFPTSSKENSFVTYTCNRTYLQANFEEDPEILEGFNSDG